LPTAAATCQAAIIHRLSRNRARRKQTPEQRALVFEPKMGRATVIDTRAADLIDRPRQPDLTIIAADDAPAAIAALHRDKNLANVHGLDSPTR